MVLLSCSQVPAAGRSLPDRLPTAALSFPLPDMGDEFFLSEKTSTFEKEEMERTVEDDKTDTASIHGVTLHQRI